MRFHGRIPNRKLGDTRIAWRAKALRVVLPPGTPQAEWLTDVRLPLQGESSGFSSVRRARARPWGHAPGVLYGRQSKPPVVALPGPL